MELKSIMKNWFNGLYHFLSVLSSNNISELSEACALMSWRASHGDITRSVECSNGAIVLHDEAFGNVVAYLYAAEVCVRMDENRISSAGWPSSDTQSLSRSLETFSLLDL